MLGLKLNHVNKSPGELGQYLGSLCHYDIYRHAIDKAQ